MGGRVQRLVKQPKRHSGVNLVTTNLNHNGQAVNLLNNRTVVYEQTCRLIQGNGGNQRGEDYKRRRSVLMSH